MIVGGGPSCYGQAAAPSTPSWVPSVGNYIEIGSNHLEDVVDSPDVTWAARRIIDIWNSGVYCKDAGTYGAYIPWGAGHAYRQNGVHAFSFAAASGSCTWSRLRARSAVTDILGASEEGDTDGLWADGAPSPPHTYDQLVYVPAASMGNSQGSMVAVRQSALGVNGLITNDTAHFFDIAAATWSHSTNQIPANAHNPSSAQGFGSGVFDQTRNCIWFLDQGATTHIAKLDIATKTWSSQAHGSASYVGGLYMTAGYCSSLDVVVWWLSPASGSKIVIWDPTNTTLTWNATQAGTAPTGGANGTDVQGRGTVGMEWCAHASVQKFYGLEYIGSANYDVLDAAAYYPSATIKTLTPPATHPGTWTWGSETFTAQGGAGAIQNKSSAPRFNSLRWSDILKSFVWVNSWDGPVNVFRPAAAS